jgi:hypothetical protein
LPVYCNSEQASKAHGQLHHGIYIWKCNAGDFPFCAVPGIVLSWRLFQKAQQTILLTARQDQRKLIREAKQEKLNIGRSCRPAKNLRREGDP